MFARILCPVDFSAGSRHALDQAVALARWCDATIAVLYVHAMPLGVPAAGVGAVPPPIPLTDEERSSILQNLADYVADDRAAGASIDTLFDEAVAVPRAIVHCARQLRADVIVMGTHGRSGFTRLVLGSVSNKVMKTAPCPTLVVPPRATDAVPIAWNRIVCALDFSSTSCRTLALAASLAQKTGARLTVVHVVEMPAEGVQLVPDLTDYRSSRFDQARASLHAAIGPEHRAAADIDELLLAGKPYREIVRLASDQQADLVVLGAHGTGGLGAPTFGSTTQHVVRQSTCPVMVVPAG